LVDDDFFLERYMSDLSGKSADSFSWYTGTPSDVSRGIFFAQITLG
jgi:hypothetical protein